MQLERRTAASARILAIDDDPANLRLIERIFERAGYAHVEGFTEPAAALQAAAVEPPDLVLVDLEMPGLDGLGVLRALRQAQPADAFLPVLIVTGNHDRTVRRAALDQGATDFLTKPFDTDEVLLRSRNLIETRLLHEALATRAESLHSAVTAGETALAAVSSGRAAVAASLERAAALETPDEIAAALCADLAAVIGAPYVTLLVFETEDRAVSYVAHNARSSADVGYVLAAERSRELWDRGGIGPWVEEQVARPARGRDGEHHLATGWRSAIYAPVRGGDQLLGLLGVGSATARPADSLARDLASVVDYATVAGALLGRSLTLRRRASHARQAITAVIAERAFTPVFQPIVAIPGSIVVGYEALTRFTDGTRPDRRFAAASDIGLGLELELATLAAAIDGATSLPRDSFLSLNVSPAALLANGDLGRVLQASRRPIVLELTEHTPVTDYAALRKAIGALGVEVRVAVDDAGAGYASMQHVVELRPDLVKLDISLVRGIDGDPARQALIAGMRYFAERTGCRLLAEGIETEAELRTVVDLGVALGQGYLLGKPESRPAQVVAAPA